MTRARCFIWVVALLFTMTVHGSQSKVGKPKAKPLQAPCPPVPVTAPFAKEVADREMSALHRVIDLATLTGLDTRQFRQQEGSLKVADEGDESDQRAAAEQATSLTLVVIERSESQLVRARAAPPASPQPKGLDLGGLGPVTVILALIALLISIVTFIVTRRATRSALRDAGLL